MNAQLINRFEGLESGLMPLSRKEFFKSAPDLADDSTYLLVLIKASLLENSSWAGSLGCAWEIQNTQI
jgi:hypothetical protein